MKKLENPTTFFFKQAQNITKDNNDQIEKFIAKLINKDTCQLCQKNYDVKEHIPRIMIHCGHTFCSVCLNKFFMNRRVRCPMCLKLVKYIDSIERLPINHSIYHHLAQKQNQKLLKQGKNHDLIDASKVLFSEFERVQKEAHIMQNPQKIDTESGLPFCVFHNERVDHFYCELHKISGCRVCIQLGHSKPQCKVIDLYNVEDPQKYLNPLQQRIQEPDLSEPFINFKNKEHNMLGLNHEDIDDDDDDDDQDQDQDQQEQSSSSLDRKSI